MSISPNFTIVTLGVADLERSVAFYRALGWEQRGDLSAGITWFRTSGTWIGVFGHADLAADIGVAADPPAAYRGITVALNLRDEQEVDAALAHAVESGAHLVKPAERAEWGGYSGYFADPDGHLWEAAFAPGSRLLSMAPSTSRTNPSASTMCGERHGAPGAVSSDPPRPANHGLAETPDRGPVGSRILAAGCWPWTRLTCPFVGHRLLR